MPKILVVCAQCGSDCLRRRDKVLEKNYCSPACRDKARRVDGARWRDPEQIKEYMREYRAKNKTKINALSQNWSKQNREKRNANQRARRARGQGRGFMGRARIYLAERYGESCLKCGETDRIEVDHVIPISAGGKNELGNMQLLCRSCNARKGAATIDYRHNADVEV